MTLLAASEPVVTEHIELVVAGSLALVAIHLFTRHIRERLLPGAHVGNSLFGGLAAGYVFLVLIPEIDQTHDVLGESVHLLILAGFLIFYGLEIFTLRKEEHRGAQRTPLAMFWVRVGFMWTYNFVLVLTFPDELQESESVFLLTVIVLGTKAAFSSYALQKRHAVLYQRRARWVLATAPLMGGAVDIVVVEFPAAAYDVLIAMLAGFLLLDVFSEELPSLLESRFAWFLSGTAAYVTLFLLRF